MKNIFLLFYCTVTLFAQAQLKKQPVLGHRSVKIITAANLQFKDLDRKSVV